MTSNPGKVLKEVLRAKRPNDAWAGELRELREDMEPVTNPGRADTSIRRSWSTPSGSDSLDRAIGNGR